MLATANKGESPVLISCLRNLRPCDALLRGGQGVRVQSVLRERDRGVGAPADRQTIPRQEPIQ